MVRRFRVKIDGKTYEVEVEEITGTPTISRIKEEETKKKMRQVAKKVREKEEEKTIEVESKREIEKEKTTESDENLKIVTAPMSGMIVSVDVEEGVKVSPGQTLLVLEAMKMENSIISECSGVVKEVLVKKGDSVETGQKLLIIKSS
ncbi:MAG: biotin/lipoyl-binding protein [Thermotogae bacterium]|nr:biotin/lipoyl-binding protein [Thermotogota bacterium]